MVRDKDALEEKLHTDEPGNVISLGWEQNDINDIDGKEINVKHWDESKQSLGAALHGMSECLNRFNVLKVKGKRHIPQYALTGILASLILAFVFILPGILKYKKEQSILAINAMIDELHPKAMISNRLSDEIDNILDTTNKINEIIKNESRRIDILAELTRAIPDDTWVKQLSIKEDGFEIEGIGLSGAKVLTLLEYSPRFNNVGFISSVTKYKVGKERFKIKGIISDDESVIK